MLLCIMSCVLWVFFTRHYLTHFNKLWVGFLSKEGNNHDSHLELVCAYVFMLSEQCMDIFDAQLKYPLVGAVTIFLPFDGHSLGFFHPWVMPHLRESLVTCQEIPNTLKLFHVHVPSAEIKTGHIKKYYQSRILLVNFNAPFRHNFLERL